MLWPKDILLFTMVVMTLISSLKAGPGAFSETGAVYGAVSENTIRFGKLLIGAEERFHLAEAKLHRLGPSVLCGNDSMTLRIPGAIRSPHFLVGRGDQSIVPLSEMPASCGFSLKRARRDVSLVAPYQGCHVQLQDGSYVLPLLVLGAPVQMSCPASNFIPTVSCFPSYMSISLGIGVDDDKVKVKVDGSWQPLLLTPPKCSFTLETVDGSLVITAPFIGSCLEVKDAEMQLPLMYGDREVTLSCPVTSMPVPFRKPWYRPHSPHYPVPPTVPPTTLLPLLQDPNQHVFPHMYPISMFDPYLYSSGSAAKRPRYQKFPPYIYHSKSPAEATTTPSRTTAAQFAGYPPIYPRFYGRQSFKPFVPAGEIYRFMP